MPWALIVFLTFANLFNYFDRYIVHSVEPILKSDFALSNSQSALMGAAFVFGYCIFSPLFGFLGDRKDRRFLMGIGLFVWSLSTALTGWSVSFLSFMLARSLVGIGEASFGSIAPGYLKGRIVDTISLNNALSVFYVAIPVGSALGFVAGGEIAESWGWRAVFFLAAIPGVLLSFGFFKLKKEDRSRVPKESIEGGFVRGLQRITARADVRLVILGYVFNTFALNGVAMFVVRHGTSLGMEESHVSAYFGYILAGTGFIGTLGGGFLASRFAVAAKNQVQGLLTFVSLTTLLGAPFLCLAFAVGSSLLFFSFCFVAQIALFAGVAPLNSVLVARAPQGLETLTQGLTIFSIQLFGGALGPIVIGKVADVLEGSAFIQAPQQALALALQVATLAMVMSGILWWWASRETARVAADR